MRVFELMSRAFDTARSDESVVAADARMRNGHYDHLIVVDDGEVVGYVSRRRWAAGASGGS
jgi:CBS domain-containing protein